MSVPCPYQGGPPLNTDIGGIGVRLSFYLQILFVAWLSARSTSGDEISSALYTLIATNVAMVATSLILAFKTPSASMSFHDALVVFYLLYASWVTIIFSLPTFTRIKGRSCSKCSEPIMKGPNSRLLGILSVLQSYLGFGFTFCLLATAPAFGSHPECNNNAVVVLFKPFPALHAGRIVGWIATVIAAACYTTMTIKDYTPRKIKKFVKRRLVQKKREKTTAVPDMPNSPDDVVDPQVGFKLHIGDPGSIPSGKMLGEGYRGFDYGVAWNVILQLVLTTILWALAVMNTELLIVRNEIQPANDWQYGQILALCLVAVPLASVIKIFRHYGLRHSFLADRASREERLIHEDCAAKKPTV